MLGQYFCSSNNDLRLSQIVGYITRVPQCHCLQCAPVYCIVAVIILQQKCRSCICDGANPSDGPGPALPSQKTSVFADLLQKQALNSLSISSTLANLRKLSTASYDLHTSKDPTFYFNKVPSHLKDSFKFRKYNSFRKFYSQSSIKLIQISPGFGHFNLDISGTNIRLCYCKYAILFFQI